MLDMKNYKWYNWASRQKHHLSSKGYKMKIAQMMAVETASKALLDSYTMEDFIRDCEPAMAKEKLIKGKIVVTEYKIRPPKPPKPQRDMGEISVKFDNDRNIVEATSERLARIENYRMQAEQCGENDDCELIPFKPNEPKQESNVVGFIRVMYCFHTNMRARLEMD